jgi:hypothetical protein
MRFGFFGFESNNPLGNFGRGRAFEAAGGGGTCKLMVPARGNFESMRELIPFAGAKFKGEGSMSNSTEAKLRVAKLLADKVGAVRRRIRAVGGGRSTRGERGGVLKKKQGTRVVVKGVRDGWRGSFYSADVVTAMMVDCRAKVKCAVAVVGPARASLVAGDQDGARCWDRGKREVERGMICNLLFGMA